MNPATCHPDKPRKVKDGRCDTCYARDRYQSDPEHRERIKERSRKSWHETARSLTPEQKARKLELRRKRYAEDPEYREKAIAHARRIKTGATAEQYDMKMVEQAGVCAICRMPSEGRGLAQDHDHTTGQLRGLLCGRCNTALGLLGDDPERLGTAHQYLVHWRSQAS